MRVLRERCAGITVRERHVLEEQVQTAAALMQAECCICMLGVLRAGLTLVPVAPARLGRSKASWIRDLQNVLQDCAASLILGQSADIGELEAHRESALGPRPLHVSRDSDMYAARTDNAVLWLLLWKGLIAFPTGLLVPLALVGVALVRRRREHALVLGLVATQVIFVLGFFVTTRYRLPLCALAMPYAARSLVGMRGLGRAGGRRSAAALAAGSAALVVCNWQLGTVPAGHLPFEYAHHGHVLAERGEGREAVSSWHKALALDPAYVEAYFELAAYYQSIGQLEAAAVHFARGLALAPAAYPAREKFADVLFRQGKAGAALNQLELALASAPGARARRRVCALERRLRAQVPPECSD